MSISARNQLKGTVKSIKFGNILAGVILDGDGLEIVAAITRSSAEGLGLKVGDEAAAMIKAAEVMLTQ